MYGFIDVNIEQISVIAQKTERAGFLYRCNGRLKNGFVFVTNGNGYYENANGRILLKKDCFVFLEEGSLYTIGCEEDGFTYITTAFDTIPKKCFSSLRLPAFADLQMHPDIARQIVQLLQVWEARSTLYLMQSRNLLTQIFIALYDAYAKKEWPAKDLGRLSPAIEHISRFYDQEISMDMLASLCGLSVSHFRRIFKQVFGISPAKYREQVRLYWAKQMLRSDLFTVSEIATKLGYYDIYHFSNDFRKRTGLSPKQYTKGLSHSE